MMNGRSRFLITVFFILTILSISVKFAEAAHIYLYYDGSCSFRHLEAAKKSGIDIVENLLPGRDSVTILVFDNKPRLMFDSFLNSKGDVRAAISAIDGIQRGHLERVTDIESAWNYGSKFVSGKTTPEDRIFIFSDLIHDYSRHVSLNPIPDGIPVTALYISPESPRGYDHARKALAMQSKFSAFNPAVSDEAVNAISSRLETRKNRFKKTDIMSNLTRGGVSGVLVLMLMIILIMGPGRKNLAFSAGTFKSKTFSALDGPRFTVGSSPECDIIVSALPSNVGQFLVKFGSPYFQHADPAGKFQLGDILYCGDDPVKLDREGTIHIAERAINYRLERR